MLIDHASLLGCLCSLDSQLTVLNLREVWLSLLSLSFVQFLFCPLFFAVVGVQIAVLHRFVLKYSLFAGSFEGRWGEILMGLFLFEFIFFLLGPLYAARNVNI